MTNARKKYDLEEGTARFGEAIVELVKTLRQDPVNVRDSPVSVNSLAFGTHTAGGSEWRRKSI